MMSVQTRHQGRSANIGTESRTACENGRPSRQGDVGSVGHARLGIEHGSFRSSRLLRLVVRTTHCMGWIGLTSSCVIRVLKCACWCVYSSPYSGRAICRCKDAARALSRRLAHKNPKVVLLTFTLLDCCFKNAGQKFHFAAAGKDAAIADSIAAHASGKSGHTDPEVRASAASLLQELAIAFGPQRSSTPWTACFDRLSAAGVSFPSIDPATVTVYPVPQFAADPALLAARAAAVPPPLPGSSPLGLPPGLQSHAQRLAPAAMQAQAQQQQQHAYPAPPGMTGPSVGMGYPMGPAYGAATAGSGGRGGGYPPMPGYHQPQPMHRQAQPTGLAALPVEAQLAAVDSAFEKLRRDIGEVRRVIAQGAQEGVAGRTGPGAEVWLDAVDFCALSLPRLAALVEIGVQGVLDEGLFEECLAVNEGAARVAQAGQGGTDAAAAAAAQGESGRTYAELQDLVDFDKPRSAAAVAPPAAAAAVAGGDDLLGLSFSTGHAQSVVSGTGSASVAQVHDPFADMRGPGPTPAASVPVSALSPAATAPVPQVGAAEIGFDDFAPSTGSAAALPAGPAAGASAAADPFASLSSFDAPATAAAVAAAGGTGSSAVTSAEGGAAQAQKSSVEDEIDDLLKA